MAKILITIVTALLLLGGQTNPENNGEASIFSKIKSLFSKDREQKTPVPPALKLKKEKGK